MRGLGGVEGGGINLWHARNCFIRGNCGFQKLTGLKFKSVIIVIKAKSHF